MSRSQKVNNNEESNMKAHRSKRKKAEIIFEKQRMKTEKEKKSSISAC